MQKHYFIYLLLCILYSGINMYATNNLTWEKNTKNSLKQMSFQLTNKLKPWHVPDKIYNVEDFGAINDGRTINTEAIQKAIDACSANGGGIVKFSKGEYATGTFRIKSGVLLEICEGAKILGSTNIYDYPEIKEEFKSVMSENYYFRQSLIYAEKANKIGITGKGEIYFRGEIVNFPGKETAGPIENRPLGIRMIECSEIVLSEIFLRNSASWMQSYIACKNLIFDNIHIENQANFNNDGLNLDGCKNVIIKDCFINAENDALCLKGCSNIPTENVIIENSILYSRWNAFKIGTDTQGDFKNIILNNTILGGTPTNMKARAGHKATSAITIATVDGGNISNILVSNVIIKRSRCPIFMLIGNRGRVIPGNKKPEAGKINNIIIENISGDNNYIQGSFISGFSENNTINNVIIKNVCLQMEGGGTHEMTERKVHGNDDVFPDAFMFHEDGLPAYGFYLRNAENIFFFNTKIIPINKDSRPFIFRSKNTNNIKIID